MAPFSDREDGLALAAASARRQRGGTARKPNSRARAAVILARCMPMRGQGKLGKCMRSASWAALAAALICFANTSVVSASPPAVSKGSDGSVSIDGHNLRCGRVRNVLDPRLPNLGIAMPDRRLLVINPRLLTSHPKTVRLFVFQHECGHHHVGASELSADCWAVRRGVSDGWLDRAGLTQVCRSFGGAPATATHPSAERRCRNLDKCFARAEAEKASIQRRAVFQGAEPPQLIVGLTLIREGVSR